MRVYYEIESPVVAAIELAGRLLAQPIHTKRQQPPTRNCYRLVTMRELRDVAGAEPPDRRVACFRAQTRLQAELLLVGRRNAVSLGPSATTISGLRDLIGLPEPLGLSTNEFRLACAGEFAPALARLHQHITHELRRSDHATSASCLAAWRTVHRLVENYQEDLREAVRAIGEHLHTGALQDAETKLHELHRRMGLPQ